MIDHVGFKVSDFAVSKAFYERVLAPLGYGLLMEVTPEMTGSDTRHAGFGTDRKPAFWISTGNVPPDSSVHVALHAKSRADVDAFYAGALAAGARDNGPPGIRAHYHPNYYGAFVLDPDGHNIEAVCHLPEAPR